MRLRLANDRSADQDHFDLLPFIAIMMCLLGALLLVTMSMAAINIGAGAGEGWVPEPDAASKTPVLIEWDGVNTIWHAEGGYRTIDPRHMAPLFAWLTAHKQTHYALFTVRPTGFGSFRTLAEMFEDRGIEIGFEPIEQGKSVRLLLPEGRLAK